MRDQPSLARCSSATSRSSVAGQRSPNVVTPSKRATRLARPGAWASTSRAAGFSQKLEGFPGSVANPDRTRSSSHTPSSSRPAVTLASREATLFAAAAAAFSAAAGSSGASAGTGLAACFCSFSTRLASHSVVQAGGAFSAIAPGCCARIRNRPSPCLHGNLRLGHEHLKAGPLKSIDVW